MTESMSGMSGNKKKQKKYATLRHPTIEAAVEGMYYFADKAKAIERLAKIRQTFVGRKQTGDAPPDPESYTLWIRGYALSEDEAAYGYRGHYARLFVTPGDDGFWSIGAQKLEVPLHRHPQRQRPKYDHPDWHYPVMRAIKAGRLYDSYDQALGELETLHIDFPDVTIPGKGKLHLIVYEGKHADSYTRKYILELQAVDETRYRIVAKPKDPASPHTRKLRQKRHALSEEAIGAFTAKLKGERFRRK